jgi:signal transduction histidine kinase
MKTSLLSLLLLLLCLLLPHSSWADDSLPTAPRQNTQNDVNLLDKSEIEQMLLEENNRWRSTIEQYETRATIANIVAFLFLVALLMIIFYHFWLQARNQKQLQEQNRIIQTQNERLLASHQALEEANQTKDTLLSVISHDIRSPLASFSAFLKILEEHSNAFSPEETQKIAADLRLKVDHMGVFMNNLLKWAQVQSGKLYHVPEAISVKETILQVVSLFELEITKKELAIREQIAPNNYVWADRQMFEFIIRNLLSNAIKFTPIGGEIFIFSNTEENHNSLFVRDTGVGMSEEECKMLFESKQHFSKRGTAAEQGTGLGLVLCKEFIERNEGTMHVSSKVDKGTTFEIRLPLPTAKMTENESLSTSV